MDNINPYAPPTAKVEDIEALPVAGEAPALWNPAAASSWSLFMSPVFGSILHMKNWQALGEPELAQASKRWAIGSGAFYVLLGVVGAFLPDAKVIDAVTRFGGLALLVAWYYASGKPQQKYVTERFGKSYPRRGWARPLLMAIGCLIGFAAGMFVVGLLLALIFKL